MASHARTPAVITVRPLEVDDLPKVQEIDHRSSGRFRAYTYDDPHRCYLGGDLDMSYVAEVDGQVVGFLFGWFVEAFWAYHRGARLEMIGVDPAMRRRGVGHRLLDTFMHGCQEKGVREIHAFVHSRDRELKGFLATFSFKAGEFVDYERNIGETPG